MLDIYYTATSIMDVAGLLVISVGMIDENKVTMLVIEKVGWL